MINPLGQASTAWNTTFNRLARIPFIFFLIAIGVFFWLNGPLFFPMWTTTYGLTILPYLVMMIIFLLFSKTKTEQTVRQPMSTATFAFVLGVFATVISMSFLIELGVIHIPEFPHGLFYQFVILQFCVVATAEEVMFRGVLLAYTGIFISSFLFAIWHLYAYSILFSDTSWTSPEWVALLIPFFIGIILCLVVKNKKLGIPCAIGIHGTYNCIVLGAFVLNGGIL